MKLTPAGRAAVIGSLAVLLWSVPGLVVNPDFGTGDAASSERVLWVDMNGWHAVSGFLIAIPGLLLARNAELVRVFDFAAAAGLYATGVWALFSNEVAGGLFVFPNNESDAVLHFATASIFLAGALWPASRRVA